MKKTNTNIAVTSESVTSGHPDKVADQIADAILDEMLKRDENARVAVEVLLSRNSCVVSGEASKNAMSGVDIEGTIRKTILDIGYKSGETAGFDENTEIISSMKEQSEEIAGGVNKEDQGAGDQGMVYGYACDENEALYPTIALLANSITQRLDECRRTGKIKGILPDGKSQVTYDTENGKLVKILVSVQHKKDKNLSELKGEIYEKIVLPLLKSETFEKAYVEGEKFNTAFDIEDLIVNPLGSFTEGGPGTDTGLTGRKIVVDTYGGFGRVGGGAFSGKDPSKIDRSAAYMARYIAKNIINSKIAKKCEIQLGYIIGLSNPVSISVNTFSTGTMSDKEIADKITEEYDLRPKAIIDFLQLKRPIYRYVGNYSHFGNTFDSKFNKEWATWENLK